MPTPKNKKAKKTAVGTTVDKKKAAKKESAKAKTVSKSPAKKSKAISGAKKKPAKKAKRKPETLMCFLTTACVNYYALPDDGYELNTLRHYRDTYLASTENGRKLIQNYYQVSPGLVTEIEKDKNKKSVYAYIYSEVKSSCAAIEQKQFELAKKLYKRMVKTLQKKYSFH